MVKTEIHKGVQGSIDRTRVCRVQPPICPEPLCNVRGWTCARTGFLRRRRPISDPPNQTFGLITSPLHSDEALCLSTNLII